MPGTVIANVARHYGFSSPQYFATAFKRILGITPAKYGCVKCQDVIDRYTWFPAFRILMDGREELTGEKKSYNIRIPTRERMIPWQQEKHSMESRMPVSGVFAEAGYTLANRGQLITWPSWHNPKRECPIDNIIVKGFEMSDVQVRGHDKLSDHKMISCRLKFKE